MESSRSTLSLLRLFLLVAASVMVLSGSPSLGQDSTWTDGAGDGLWSSAGNWSLGVPGVNPGDTATFNTATGTSTIDLSGAQTTGGITFDTGAQSFTIGVAGADTLTLSQSDDNNRNDTVILMTAGVTADQTIAADLILGDGAGTTGFNDQVEIINFSPTATLFVTGDISAGTGAGPGDVQRLIWGGFNSGSRDIEFSGIINETPIGTSASRIDMFVGGTELTWTGSVNTTTTNYLQTIIRDNGTLTLAAGSDIGTGLMEVRNGTLNVNADQTFSNGLTIGQSTQGNTVNINIGAANTIALNSNFTYVVDDNNANTGTISGGTLQLAGGNRTFAVNDNDTVASAEITIASDITNDGTERTLIKGSQGTLLLSGNNTYGDTTVNNGLLILSGGSALSDTNLLTVNQNGSLGIAQFNNDETIGSLAGTGTVDIQTSTLTVGDATNTDFSGLITGTTGGVTKVGSGTLTLSNAGTHTYTGDTNVNGGLLNLDGTVSGNVIVGTGGNIGGEGGTTGDLTYGTGTFTLDIDAGTSDAFSIGGNLDTTAATTITVNINGSGSGDIVVFDYGSRSGVGVANFAVGAVANPTARGVGSFNDTGSAITISNGALDNTWVGADATNPTHWVVGSASGTTNWNNSADNVFEQGDSVIFNDIAGETNVARQENVTVDNVTFNNTSSIYTLNSAGSGEILTIEGSLNLNGTASVTINGPVTMGNSASIEGSGDVTFAGVISGAGGLTKNGTGTTTITASIPDYSGTTSINEGTLVFQNTAIQTASVFNHVIASGATLEYSTSGGNNDPTALDVSGSGTFKKTGAGTFSLISSQSDWAMASGGLIHVEAGSFSFGGGTPGRWGNNLGDMLIDSGASFEGRSTSIVIDALDGEGTFGVGGRNTGDGTGIGLTLGVDNGDGTFNGIIRNTPANGEDFNLLKVGTGTQSLNGNNTYTGDTTINAGQLNIGGTNVSNFIVGDGIGVETGANIGGEGSTSGNITFTEATHILEIDASTIGALGSTSGGGLDVSGVDVGGITVNVNGTNLSSAAGVTVLTYGSGGFTGAVDRFALGTGAVRTSGGTFTDDGVGNITVDIGNVTNTWRGADPNNPTLWDVGTTENWSNTDDQVFQQGDAVVFDDTAAGTTATLQQDTFVDTITFDNNSKAITVNAAGSETLTVVNGITTNGSGSSSIDSALTSTTGMVFDGAGDLTVNGVISGSGGLVKNGAGTTTLTTQNSYTGTVNVNAGTLKLETGALVTAGNANNTASVASGATLEFDTGATGRSINTFDHGGEGTFKKTGTTQFNQVSGNSDITYGVNGLIHVAEGIFNFGGATPGNWSGNLGDMLIDSGAVFQGRSTSIFIDALDGEGTFGVGGQIGPNPGLTLGVSDGDGVFDGVIQDTSADGAAFSITKTGSGTQTLNGNNTYTGDTLISGGQLNIGGTNVSNITVGDGTGSGANIGGEGSTSGNLVFAETSHALEIDAGTAAALGSTGTGITDWTAATGNITVNIVGSGAGPITVLTYGSGINGSSLSNLVLGSGASARGAGVFTDDMAGNITIDLGYQNASWLGTDVTNSTFWDVATTANWGTTDTFFQTGDDVTFGDGASDFNPTLQSDLTAGAVNFEAGSNIYTLGSSSGQTLTTTTGVSVTGASNVILNANIAGTGGLDVSGSGVVTLNGTNTYTGDTTVSNGTLTLGANDVIGDSSAVVVTGGSLNFINGVIETLHSLQLSGTSLQLGFSDGAGAADLTLNNDSSISAIRVGTTGTLRLADGATLSVGDVSQLGDNDAITFDIGAGASATVSGNVNSGNGNGALDKTGAGTLRLSANGSAYGGGTRITGGVLEFQSISNVGSDPTLNDSSLGNADTLNVLQIGSNTNSATLRMFGTNAKNVSDRLVQLGDAGGTIDVEEAAQTLTLNGAISNDTANGGTSGSLTKAGAGTLVLGGNNTYSGGTTISGGTLQVTTGGNLGDSTADVVNNAALVFDTADSNTYSGVFSGSGTLTHSGTGTTTLSGDNTYTGSTSVTGGTLLVDGNSSAATGNVTVATGATLGGTGTIGGATTLDGGTLSAATTTTVGTLNMAGDLSASSSSTWLVDLNNAVSGESDLIAFGDISTRTLNLTNFNLSLNDFGTFNLSTGFTYDIATYTDTGGALSSTFAGLGEGSQITGSGGGQYFITYGNQDGFGGDNYSIRLTAVPEPTTFLLLLPLLLAGFYLARRRKLQQTTAEA